MIKKYSSILELFSRNTFYKILFIIIGMAGTELFWFRQQLREWIPDNVLENGMMPVEEYSMEWIVDQSNSYGWFAIGFVLITTVLCWNGCNFGSKSSYTLQRMRITEKRIVVIQSIYNTLCYGLFFMAQIGIFLLQYLLYCEYGKNITNQTLFLAFYRNAFMHSILPLEDGFRWFMNVIMIVSCSVSAALFSYLQRRGKTPWSAIVITACILLGFETELGELMIWVTAALALVIAGSTLYRHIFRKREAD